MVHRFTKGGFAIWSVQKKISQVILFFLFAFTLSPFIYSQSGLKAEYYDGQNFDRLITTRIESKIDLSWNRTPPVEGINPHVCSIRWTGKIRPSKSGDYTFSARVDDGIRVWVNDELVIDDWNLNDVGLFNGTVHLSEGKYYNLKVEYFNALVEGEIRLLWDLPKERKWYQILAKKNFEVIQPEYFFQPDATPNYDLPEENTVATLASNN